jgi:hypothetical protein
MWHWISCYLVGHDYSICCESGAMFLRCANCGRRSQGWDVVHTEHPHMAHEHGTQHAPALAPARNH